MATTIKLKNSVTTTNTPTSLAQGEVAINITDKKVWVGNAATTPIQLLGDGGSVNFTTVDTTNLQVTNIKAKDGTASASIANSTGAFTVAAAFAANGGATLGDASGDALTINSSAVSIPNGLNFDSNTLVIDAANNRVGIGTASPSGKLHAFSASSGGTATANADEIIAENSGNCGITILSGATSLGNLFFADSGDTADGFVQYDQNGRSLRFGSAAAERMRIDSSGNVGIGTSSPISNGAGYTTLTLNGSTSGVLEVVSNNVTKGQIYSNGTNIIYNAQAGAAHQWNTTGTERMRLDTSGNLGLGVTPAAWRTGSDRVMQIGSYMAVFSDSNITSEIGNNMYLTTGQRTYLNTAAASRYMQNAGVHSWYNAPSGTAGNAITFTQAMTLDASGNLGIGTTAPQAVLDLGTGTSGRGLTWGGTTGANRYATIFAPYSNGGIVLGASFHGSTSADSYLTSYTGTTYANGIRLNVFDAAGIQFFTDGSASKTAGAAFTPTERMRITSGGEVYIAGTTDQGAYNLQCNGTGVWGAGAYVNGSDERIKDKIAPLDSGLDVVAKLNPVTYKYKKDWSKDQSTQTGFIAQELLTALEGKNYVDGVVQQGGEYMSVAYQNIIPILTKAIQEQQAMIEELKQEVALLKSK